MYQIYQMLLNGISLDTGEVFELALSDRTYDYIPELLEGL
ncbi:hypothetical protein CRC_02468 [Cylindrospermopsis raciborskii CS-505]|nr:hypothetical protein CRC_02468 [Cylindrospermopsis raciborskii CS-505]